jgi:hypothetical protein
MRDDRGLYKDVGCGIKLRWRSERGIFDRVVGLQDVPAGYRAMNERESIKVLVTPS